MHEPNVHLRFKPVKTTLSDVSLLSIHRVHTDRQANDPIRLKEQCAREMQAPETYISHIKSITASAENDGEQDALTGAGDL